MNSPQIVYNLVSMSDTYVKAWERRRVKEREYSDAVKGMTKEERKEFNKTWRENIKGSLDPDLSLGKAYRGSFTDLDLLIKIIEDQDDPYGICECYYTYLLIEKHNLNCIDGLHWGEKDTEIWYKMNDDCRYVRIDKPECFKKTVGFS